VCSSIAKPSAKLIVALGAGRGARRVGLEPAHADVIPAPLSARARLNIATIETAKIVICGVSSDANSGSPA
jgi:hypothetical protein